MLQYIKGPDFPTGGIIYGYEGVREAHADGPRPRHDACQDRHRAYPQRPRVHRHHRNSLHDQQGRDDQEDRRHDQRKEDRRHLLHQRRVRPQRPAHHHHPQTRRRGERRAQYAFQELSAPDFVRGEQHRAGERPSAAAADARPGQALRRPPPRRGGAPHALRPAQGRGTAAHRAGPPDRAGQHRRDRRTSSVRRRRPTWPSRP